ncbi:protein MEMO1-like [Xenia sp. Carnegie-2017]|uniref:protein MEMO1-like n=1 Tax=Xenia sp. Carnegie-2017 TaxID=2897299 RepID=UPI001F0470AD|nr:protein MEMO1-like [Xenia sp. Carnegie-2017]
MSERKATHAGTWYSSNKKDLSDKLERWLSKASCVESPVKAIIAPHAGYSYCGAVGAHSYRQLNSKTIKRIFILGPSHHVYLSGCAISGTSVYNTPLTNLKIDTQVNEELMESGLFEVMNINTDEDEHSIEMQLPYIAKVMEGCPHEFTIVPILVGSLSMEKEKQYGQLFSKYFANPGNFFIISSDFCHWGRRFRFTYHEKKYKYIYQSIEALDKMGMDLIEKLLARDFIDYLKKYGNTICGRHPIAVMLFAVEHLHKSNGHAPNYKFRFLNYAQSNNCQSMSDSSVSYAAGALYQK